MDRGIGVTGGGFLSKALHVGSDNVSGKENPATTVSISALLSKCPAGPLNSTSRHTTLAGLSALSKVRKTCNNSKGISLKDLAQTRGFGTANPVSSSSEIFKVDSRPTPSTARNFHLGKVSFSDLKSNMNRDTVARTNETNFGTDHVTSRQHNSLFKPTIKLSGGSGENIQESSMKPNAPNIDSGLPMKTALSQLAKLRSSNKSIGKDLMISTSVINDSQTDVQTDLGVEDANVKSLVDALSTKPRVRSDACIYENAPPPAVIIRNTPSMPRYRPSLPQHRGRLKAKPSSQGCLLSLHSRARCRPIKKLPEFDITPFSFDSPSPDDTVLQKQAKAFSGIVLFCTSY